MGRNAPNPSRGVKRNTGYATAVDTSATALNGNQSSKFANEIRDKVLPIDRSLLDAPSSQALTIGDLKLGKGILVLVVVVVATVAPLIWQASNISTRVDTLVENVKEVRQKADKLSEESIKGSTRIEGLDQRIKNVESHQQNDGVRRR